MMLGAGGAGDGDYIDDVFDVHLYTGNGSSKTITNGLDLSGDGGLVWTKRRDSAQDHYLFDTLRGTGDYLSTNNNYSEESDAQSLSAFTSTGFTVGNNVKANGNTNTYSAWSFKKTTGFFDVVTWTGNGTAGRTISHSLGSAPGMIIVKKTSANEDWTVYHRGIGNTKWLYLNSTDDEQSGGANPWNSTDPTASVFSVSAHALVNENTATYVAYLFAHDDDQFGKGGDNPIIYCGSYTGNGSADGQYLDLGFEPQFFIQKNAGANTGGTWNMFDHIRGVVSGGNDRYFRANTNQTDGSFDTMSFVGNGVHIDTDHSNWNANGVNYVYLAVRRSDGVVGKPATAGTEVFTPVKGSSGAPLFVTPHTVDFHFAKDWNIVKDWNVSSRLTQGFRLETNTNIEEDTNQYQMGDFQTGWGSYTGGDGSRMGYNFKRHAGFDLVCYKGMSTVYHSLGVRPEMVWVKQRDGGSPLRDWVVGCPDILGIDNNTLALNQDYAVGTSNVNMFATSAAAQSATQVVLHGNENGVSSTSRNYMMLLFASVSGISKISTYSGSSGSVTVTCGFQPRFILIKITNAVEDWIVFDTVRGIVAGNDARLRLNRDGAEVSTTDWVDLTSDGFTVNNTGDSGTNTNGNTYLYYAHA